MKYIQLHAQVRRNSSLSFKLRGQILEARANLSNDGLGNEQSKKVTNIIQSKILYKMGLIRPHVHLMDNL